MRRERIRDRSRNPALYNDETIYLRDAGRPEEALALLDQAERAGVTDEYLISVRASILARKRQTNTEITDAD